MTGFTDAQSRLAFLVGTWRGQGRGLWAAEPPFRYGEEVRITAPPGKPFLRYEQRTWALDDERPMHAELGYLRSPSPGAVELVVVQPTGFTEVHDGSVEGTTLRLRLLHLGRTPSAINLTTVVRTLEVEDGVLEYLLRLGMNDEAAADHLRASLRAVDGS